MKSEADLSIKENLKATQTSKNKPKATKKHVDTPRRHLAEVQQSTARNTCGSSIYANSKVENHSIESVSLEESARIHKMLCGDEPNEDYWRLTSEQLKRALYETCLENKQLVETNMSLINELNATKSELSEAIAYKILYRALAFKDEEQANSD